MRKFHLYRQLDNADCGPSCLRMIARHHGKILTRDTVLNSTHITKEGVSLLGLSDAIEDLNMRSMVVKIDFDTLEKETPLPCIAHWRKRHYVVVYKVKKGKVYVADPAHGLIKYTKEDFLEGWLPKKADQNQNEGILVLIEPSAQFYEQEQDKDKPLNGIKFLFTYFKAYKHYLVQLVLALFTGSLIQIAFPFLTQSIVDQGIKNQNINFIYLILIAQLMLFFSSVAVNSIRSWLLLHLGARVNISIISDFLIKLMRLPISFFDSKVTGDIMQRIDDNRRIESFLSSSTLGTIFSAFNFIIFGVILAYYNILIFIIYLVFSIVYIVWVTLFMKRLALLEYKRFDENSGERSSIIQLITGMQEIKLNNSEKRRRWEWEGIQIRLFKVFLKRTFVRQYQSLGGNFINELKNIFITILAATAVINGEMTLGMMLAVQYIIGQLNGPLASIVTFLQRAQETKLSLERISEVHNMKEEVKPSDLLQLPDNLDIQIKNLSFQYGSASSKYVLRDLNLTIPHKKVIAIVGESGSGKTTLLKLLLNFYQPTKGHLKIGNTDIGSINVKIWRDKCGAVMQDGFIFADTIARNITESSSDFAIDKEKLRQAVHIANLEETIENLPSGYETKIGSGGIQLSGGQNQRILIARAVYKSPEFLFFDEATSSLDASNEKIIIQNLADFFVGKTVLIIAHRLSTVKNADEIIVLEKGSIVERGNHTELTKARGKYYTLVKNQLELGN